MRFYRKESLASQSIPGALPQALEKAALVGCGLLPSVFNTKGVLCLTPGWFNSFEHISLAILIQFAARPFRQRTLPATQR